MINHACHVSCLCRKAITGAGLMSCDTFSELGVLFAVRHAAVLQVLLSTAALSTSLTLLQVHRQCSHAASAKSQSI